jgi:hypothetical protein
MRLNSAQRSHRGQRDGIDSPLLRAARLVRTNEAVEGLDRRKPVLSFPDMQSWLLMGSLLFDVAWLGVCLLVAMRYHAALAIVLASFPVLKWLLLLVARHSGQEGRSVQPEPLAAPAQSTKFLPTSPSGEQSDTRYPRSRIQVFADREIVGSPVSALVRDSLSSNGWKYRVVGGWLPPRRTVSPFGTVPDWWKVYQIAVEDPQGLVKYGWVRVREGKVEFRLEADRPVCAPVLCAAQAGHSEQDFPPESMRILSSSEPLVQPMA